MNNALGQSWLAMVSASLFTVLSVALVGCGPPAMQLAKKRPSMEAPLSAARLVIIRPELAGQSDGIGVSFWQGEQLIGKLEGANAMAVDLPPDTYRLAAVADNIDVIQATVAAGMTYYVYLDVTYTGISMTVQVTPLHQDHEHWGDKEEWLKRCLWVQLVPENAQAIVRTDGSRVRAVLPDFDPEGENKDRAVLEDYGS
jgi:hypothetical protein